LLPTNGGSFIDLIVSPDPTVFVCSHFDENYMVSENATVTKAWGPFTVGTNYWLYWDIDFLTGALTRGFTIYDPEHGATPPPNPDPDKHWYDTTQNIMKVWTGSVWIEKLRVFAARYQGGSAIQYYPLGSQVGLNNTRANAGTILFDPDGNPLQIFQRNRRGRFITTETSLHSQFNRIANFRVEAAIVQGEATEHIPIHHAVALYDYDKLVLARNSNANRPAIGVSTEDMFTGEVRSYITKGFITDEVNWDWSAYPAHTSIYVGSSGELRAGPDPTSLTQQAIGYIVNRNTIFVDVSPLIEMEPPSHGNEIGLLTNKNTGATIARRIPFNLYELNDTDIDNPQDGDVIRWDSSAGKWVLDSTCCGGGGGGATELDDLTDVDTGTGPIPDGYSLTYNGTTGQWEPAPKVSTLNDLTDVTASSPTVGDVLTYTGMPLGWRNVPPALQNLWLTITSDSGSATAQSPTDILAIVGGTAIETAISGSPAALTISTDPSQIQLSDLGDIDATGVADGYILVYRGGSPGGWVTEPSTTTDEFVKVSGTDTTTGHLIDKVVAGSHVTLTTQNSGGNEQLEIAVAMGMSDLTDVAFGSPIPAGHLLGYDGSEWTTIDPATLATSIDIAAGDGIAIITSGSPAIKTISLDICSIPAGTAVLDLTNSVVICDGTTTYRYTLQQVADAIPVGNAWTSITGNVGTATADSSSEPLSIIGGTAVTTTVTSSPDTVTIDVDPSQIQLSDLGGVNVPTPADGDVLVYRSGSPTGWTNEPSTTTDEFVRVSGNDTTTGHLDAKLAAGTGIGLTVLNPSGNEQYEIALDASIGQLNDVALSSPVPTGHVLGYDGSSWVPVPVGTTTPSSAGLFVTGVTSPGGGIVSDLVYAPNTVPSNVVVLEATSDQQVVRVQFLVEGGGSFYSPTVVVDVPTGSPLVGDNVTGILTQDPQDIRTFHGYADITIADGLEVGRMVYLEASHGATAAVLIKRAPQPPQIQTLAFNSIYPTVPADPTSGYPGGVQTTIKSGDIFYVSGTVENSATLVTLNSGGAVGGTFTTNTPGSSLGPVDSGGAGYKTFTIRFNASSASSIQTATAVAQNSFGSQGNTFVTSNTVTMDQTPPGVSIGSVTYPAGQQALKGSETVTVSNTVSGQSYVYYYENGGAGFISISNPNVYEPSKTVTRIGGNYLYNGNNFAIRAFKTSNGTSTTVATGDVNISNIAPTVSISGASSRLISSPAGQNYTITLTFTQRLLQAPTIASSGDPTAGSRGAWSGSGTTWSFTLNVDDADVKGVYSWTVDNVNTLSNNLYNGVTITSGATYELGGFTSRLVTVGALEQVVDLGVDITNPAKVSVKYAGTTDLLTYRGSDLLQFQKGWSAVDGTQLIFTPGPEPFPNYSNFVFQDPTVSPTSWLFLTDAAFAGSNTTGTLQIEIAEVA
jgi:hypothetical protein